MDFKDLLQIWEQSPLWFQAYLVIVQAAAIYTAIKVFLPLLRWLAGRAKMYWSYLALEDRWIWFLHKPTVTMTKKPTISITKRAGADYRRKVTAIINLQFKGNDIKLSDITLEDLRMSIWQGWSKRKARVRLNHTFQNYSDKSFKLTKEGVRKEITLEGFSNTNIPESDIDLSKPFKWRVEGIIGKVFGAHSRLLPRFKGKVN